MIAIDVAMRLPAADGPRELVVRESFAEKALVAISGPSGAGKTTLLRILAGLARPDRGRVEVGDEVWLDTARGIERPPQRRAIGFVFQDYALMPNLTVRENVAFGARRGDGDFVDELLRTTGLCELRDRRPATLSGGQRQRVALARALARRPRLLLLDEPLAAIDATLRRRLQDELAALHARFGVTTILVSHDIGEVFRLADTVVVLEAGTVTRRGTPREVFLGQGPRGRIVLSAQVLAVRPADIAYVVSLLVGTDVIDVVATADDIAGLAPGDAVGIAPKAFSPFVWKSVGSP